MIANAKSISSLTILLLVTICVVMNCNTDNQTLPPGRRLVLGFRTPFVPPASQIASITGYRVTISTPGRNSQAKAPEGWESRDFQNEWYIERPWNKKDRLPTIYLPDSLNGAQENSEPTRETDTAVSKVRDKFDVQVVLYADDKRPIARGSRRNISMPDIANDDPEIMDLLITLTPNPALWRRTLLLTAPIQSEQNVSPWLSEFWFVFQGEFKEEDVSSSTVTVRRAEDDKAFVVDGKWTIRAQGNFSDALNAPPGETSSSPPEDLGDFDGGQPFGETGLDSSGNNDNIFDVLLPGVDLTEEEENGLDILYLEPERSQTLVSFSTNNPNCPLEPGVYQATVRVRSEFFDERFDSPFGELDDEFLFGDPSFQGTDPPVPDDSFFTTTTDSGPTDPESGLPIDVENPGFDNAEQVDTDDSTVIATLSFEVKPYPNTVQCRKSDCNSDDDCKVKPLSDTPVSGNDTPAVPTEEITCAAISPDTVSFLNPTVSSDDPRRCVPRINSCERELCDNVEICGGPIGNDEIAGLIPKTNTDKEASANQRPFDELRNQYYSCEPGSTHCNAIKCNVGYNCQNSANSVYGNLPIKVRCIPDCRQGDYCGVGWTCSSSLNRCVPAIEEAARNRFGE